ncbi:MarR family winged helix-turn-helix transcriptional regulator [Jiella pacifica]|uniref:MarR family transcriptional regulator n=1 Tax=Jiella pacifica TaxID=2696469 RepID=A0A6N9TBV7_9HYPH|nr:MarR family winged helix-turn-helix transcriptional regulator [Jiella pacifica]NDW07159.1 MarR family transcriptional regulator [Jiella pacifica]
MPKLTSSNPLGFLLVDVARLFRQDFERAVVEAGLSLTPGEIRALIYVWRFEGSRQAVLAERMGVEPMTMSAYLDRLENRSLIVRTVDKNDRRAKVVNTTQAAADVFEEIRPIAGAMYERLTAGFSDEEREAISQLLTRIRRNLTSDPQILADDPAVVPNREGRAAEWIFRTA